MIKAYDPDVHDEENDKEVARLMVQFRKEFDESENKIEFLEDSIRRACS